MYSIRPEPWGYTLTFQGFIRAPEMEEWKADSDELLRSAPPSFGVFVDMTALRPLAEDAQAVMVAGQQLYAQAGMRRSAVLVDSSVTAFQFKRLAKQSGIYDWERYFASDDPDHMAKAMAWLERAVDPDEEDALL